DLTGPAKKRNRRPSARNCGQAWYVSPSANCVTEIEVPPVALTRISATPRFQLLLLDGAKRITPSLFQAPPRPFNASARTCGALPSRSIRFNFAFAKKATARLSGDQNGLDAPSVPSRASAVA